MRLQLKRPKRRVAVARRLVLAALALACALALPEVAGVLAAPPASDTAAPAAPGSAAPAASGPDVSIDLRSGVYQDTDHTFISTSTLAARATLKDLFTIRARYLADVVSSASVDVVSAATSHFDELRHEIEGGTTYADGTNTVSLGYVYSTENDWTSHSGRVGLARDFFQHLVTLGLGAAVTWNDVRRSGDATFQRDLFQGTGSLDATFVASRNDLVAISYSMIALSGYQASPYRFALFRSPSVPSQLIGNPETLPEQRLRHAIGVRWNHHVGEDSAARSHARFYVDDWGVISGTAGLEYVIGFGDFEVGALARGYVQDRADLYAAEYETRQKYMSRDKELSTFVDFFGGLRAGYRGSPTKAIAELRAEIKAEGFYFHFFDFPLLPRRSGIVAEVGLGATF